MIGLTLLELGLGAAAGVLGIVGGHPVGMAWRVFKRMRAMNLDRSKLSPEDRKKLEEIESRYSNAEAEIGRI